MIERVFRTQPKGLKVIRFSSKKIGCIFSILLILFAGYFYPAYSSYAISIDEPLLTEEDYRSSNDIFFYDSGAGCVGIADNTDIELAGESNLHKVYNYMIAAGLKDFQAAGVVGNIAIESGGDPTIKQGGGHMDDPTPLGTGIGVGRAWGLIQWDAGGRAIEYAKRAGITTPINELKTQLDLVQWHMKTETPTSAKNFWDEYVKTSTIEEATMLYMIKMEGPGIPHFAARLLAANLALNYPITEGAGGGSTDCTSDAGDGAVAGNAVKTAVNYAWPKYRKPPTFELKPEYAKAVKDAQTKGLYVGGGIHPGIDCGGFVTRVMQDSGVDPNYNKDPAGNTVNQEKYTSTSGKYTLISSPTTATLKPGDIAINNSHTYMYVGEVEGFETVIASASYSTTGASWRPPMAGHEAPADPSYRWYRFNGGTK